MKTICFWCGKSHNGKKPKTCAEYSRLMNQCCKKMEAWQVMRVIEIHGVNGLAQLALELEIKK